ncbi:hypothetical protein [Chlorogloeopsis sp. ULAP02]|uniref:hypothetical protein n=1 Tax=Chlorogloeopsis sp. ULAP02 TaxID=3107926 RepID=UPI003135DDD3
MKNVNWLIEKNIYDAEEQFLEELRKQGYIYKETKYLHFRPQEANKYFPDHDCVLFRGTLNLGRDIFQSYSSPNGIVRKYIFRIYLHLKDAQIFLI